MLIKTIGAPGCNYYSSSFGSTELSQDLILASMRKTSFIINRLFASWKRFVTVECRSRPGLNSKLIEQEDTSGLTIKFTVSFFNFTGILDMLLFPLFFSLIEMIHFA